MLAEGVWFNFLVLFEDFVLQKIFIYVKKTYKIFIATVIA